MLDEIVETLLAQAAIEATRPVMEVLSIALCFAWGRRSDQTFTTEQQYAVSENVTLRLAAARALALHTEVPIPSFLLPTVEALAQDPDPEVRWWGQDALSYRHGWASD